MTPGKWLTEEHDLFVLEAAVKAAKVRYVQARNARQPSTAMWNEYARLLHMLRLRKREMNYG